MKYLGNNVITRERMYYTETFEDAYCFAKLFDTKFEEHKAGKVYKSYYYIIKISE